jgi:hypothetical protein
MILDLYYGKTHRGPFVSSRRTIESLRRRLAAGDLPPVFVTSQEKDYSASRLRQIHASSIPIASLI